MTGTKIGDCPYFLEPEKQEHRDKIHIVAIVSIPSFIFMATLSYFVVLQLLFINKYSRLIEKRKEEVKIEKQILRDFIKSKLI